MLVAVPRIILNNIFMVNSQGFQENTIEINGLKVNYKIAGEGPAILVLHGWGGSSDSWTQVMKILAGQGFKVVAPDLPGFGKTAPPSVPWEVEDYTDFVLRFANKLGLSSFFLIGHSFGGRISVKFLAQYPEKVKKLILCSSAGIRAAHPPLVKLVYWLTRMANALLTPKYLTRLKDVLRNTLYIFLRNRDYVKAEGVMRETIIKVLEEDLLPVLSEIEKETLIVWGQGDRMVPVKFAYMFHENIKGSRLEVFPKIGHSPHLEAPEKLSKVILDFIT